MTTEERALQFVMVRLTDPSISVEDCIKAARVAAELMSLPWVKEQEQNPAADQIDLRYLVPDSKVPN